jgi:hypothetical protein
MNKADAPPVAQKPRWVSLFGVLAGGVLLLAACGGGLSKPSNGAVAHLGATTTAKLSSSQGGNSSEMPACARGPDLRGPGWLCVSPSLAYCMQTHGVPNFPEPNAQGWAPASGINTNSPSFGAASNHCLPGAQPTLAPGTPVLAHALRFSQCMRSHGISDYPDPHLSGSGQAVISTQGRRGSDLDPNNPRFLAAARACRGK